MNSRVLIILALFSVVFSSCDNDDDEDEETSMPCETTEVRDLEIMFEHSWAGADFQYDMEYDVNGTNIKFSDIRYYLSNIHIHSDDMTEQHFEDVLLVDAGISQTENLGELDLTHVHEMMMIHGLDSLTNHQDPTIAPEPLNDFEMHWSWNPDAGYKFVRIQGERDTSGSGDFADFEIHVATDGMKRDIQLMVHEDVPASGLYVHVHVDVESWFSGLDFSQELTGTHGAGVTDVIVMNNAQASFSVE